MSQIFQILFQTRDNIFVLHGVFFSRFIQIKSSFSDEKKNKYAVKSETCFSREAIEINVAKY